MTGPPSCPAAVGFQPTTHERGLPPFSPPNEKRPGGCRAFDQAINESNLPAIAATTATATAAVATTAAATAARTSAAATAAGAWLVLSFVDAQLSATHIVTVQALNGAGCIGLAHFNEPESAWASRLTIG